MQFDRNYLTLSLCYALVGVSLGVYMGASQNHGQLVAHAHVLLVGFVVSFIYAVIHKLWLPSPSATIAKVQFFLHHIGATVMFVGLMLLYGHVVPEPKIGPILGMSSIAVLVALLMMVYMVLRTSRSNP